jgi:hypothetical protein
MRVSPKNRKPILVTVRRRPDQEILRLECHERRGGVDPRHTASGDTDHLFCEPLGLGQEGEVGRVFEADTGF